MHHLLLCKVKGDTKSEARRTVERIMQNTIRCPVCENSRHDINWDYFQIVKDKDLKGYRNGMSFKKIEKELLERRKTDLQEIKNRLKDVINSAVVLRTMTKEDAPIYAADNDRANFQLKEKAIKILEGKEKAFKGGMDTTELCADIVMNNFMLPYHLQQIERLTNVIRYGEADNHMFTLHCDDNYFADLTNEKTSQGKNTYYFVVDRHF